MSAADGCHFFVGVFGQDGVVDGVSAMWDERVGESGVLDGVEEEDGSNRESPMVPASFDPEESEAWFENWIRGLYENQT